MIFFVIFSLQIYYIYFSTRSDYPLEEERVCLEKKGTQKSCAFIILSSSAIQPVRLFLLAAAQLSACHWPPNPSLPPLVPTSNNPTLPRSVFWCSLFMQVLVGVLLKPLTSLRLFPTQYSPSFHLFQNTQLCPNHGATLTQNE